jgi:hypothetical protein
MRVLAIFQPCGLDGPYPRLRPAPMIALLCAQWIRLRRKCVRNHGGMRGYPVPDTEVAVYWHHDGTVLIFPISPGRYRVLGDMFPSVPGREHAQRPRKAKCLSTTKKRS